MKDAKRDVVRYDTGPRLPCCRAGVPLTQVIGTTRLGGVPAHLAGLMLEPDRNSRLREALWWVALLISLSGLLGIGTYLSG